MRSGAKERGGAGRGGVEHEVSIIGVSRYQGSGTGWAGRCVPREPLVTVAPNRIRIRIKSLTH